jgi:phospholipid/cholesterol/gamma-HCH transport system ATP-binding protein
MAASNRIAMLHAGRIIAIGTVKEMTESTDPYVRQFMSGNAEGPIKTTP